ncbi:MAG TPA: hypothetical protein VJR89_35170, partial [Polyangiales bacterium]|nr:hypothetical protein [Polyangiales bacterium]
AHSPALRDLSRVERSPFSGMTQAIDEFLSQPMSQRRPEALHGRIRQCELQVRAYAKQLVERGADLNTSFQLDRISQQLSRAALLVVALCGMQATQVGAAFVAVVRSVTRNTSGRRLVARSSALVLRNLTDTAAAVGQDYLSTERSRWRAAFVAGAGGGVLMAVATWLKYQLASWQLPTFYEGMFFALNYGAVFCAAYLLHFTIATKLPAHTAAALARAVQQPNLGHLSRVRSFLATWRATVRLQLAGLLGNVMFAGPVAYLFDILAERASGEHVLTGEQAQHVLHANSVLGPSALYAALTGVFLWLSSLVGAAADNWTRVTRLLERLSTNVRVMRFVGKSRARPVAQWWVEHWGGLTGNLALGFMLGAIPAGAAILSLPLEIRHITVSTSSFALALASGSGDLTQLGLAAAGLLTIATVNVSVAFALALQVTLASTGRGTHGSARALVRLAMRDWLRRKHRGGTRHSSAAFEPQVGAAASSPGLPR